MNDFGLDSWLVPLCNPVLVEAVLAVRGEQGLMRILIEHFGLRPTARLCVFNPSEHETAYSLALDSVDRYENRQVGMIDALSTLPFTSQACLDRESKTWGLDDFREVSSPLGCRALLQLGLIHKGNIQHCSAACRDLFFASDLGL